MSGPKAGDLFVTGAARRGPARARVALRERLEERRAELEEVLLARVYGVADPTGVDDPAYLEGLRSAAAAGIDFGLQTIEASQDRLPLPPPALLAQARLAARSGVGLDTVLRRYTAGHAMLVDFLVEGVERDAALSPAELRRLLTIGSAAFDRLVAAVGEEHARELRSRPSLSREGRLADRVERLLAGEPIDTGDMSYDFTNWHLGVIAQGGGAREQLRALAAELNCLNLLVPREDRLVWAWLGSRDPLDPAQVLSICDWGDGLTVAVGEPAEEISGWRLTHRQSCAALTVALRGDRSVVRYADAVLIAAALDNDLLLTSLTRLYLDPLTDERDGGETLRRTLHTYFEAGGNLTSAAAAMGLSRRTIRNRLRRVEQLTGRPCQPAAAELKTALRLHQLGRTASGPPGSGH